MARKGWLYKVINLKISVIQSVINMKQERKQMATI